jgi:hypothetical protein
MWGVLGAIALLLIVFLATQFLRWLKQRWQFCGFIDRVE